MGHQHTIEYDYIKNKWHIKLENQIKKIKDIFRNGNKIQAINHCKLLISNNPKVLEIRLLLAKMLALNNDVNGAIVVLKKINQLFPGNPECIFNLGVLERGQEHYKESLNWFKKFTNYDSNSFEGWANLAETQFQLNSYEDALESSNIALKLNPNDSGVLLNKAKILKSLQRKEEALEDLTNAINISPTSIKILYEYGLFLHEEKQEHKAITIFTKISSLKPNDPPEIIIKAEVLQFLGRYDDALRHYDLLIEMGFKSEQASLAAGKIQKNRKKFNEAITYFEFAKNFANSDGDVYISQVFFATGRFLEALLQLNSYLAENKKSSFAWMMKGSTLLELNRIKEALECFYEVEKLNPDYPNLLGFIIHHKQYLCEWEELDRRIEVYKDKISKGKLVGMPFQSIAISDNLELHKKTVEININCIPMNLSKVWDQKQIYPQKRKIKIAYISPDFGQHAVSYLSIGLFENHDREQFEVYGISLWTNSYDDFTNRVISSFDHFENMANLSDNQIIEKVRKLDIDIAIDLCGFTNHNRVGIFKHRVAPIQISYLGYLGTMGSVMDYLIVDPILVPMELRGQYSEKMIYIPSYQINDRKRLPSPIKFLKSDLGIPTGAIVYGGLNNSYKISQDIFSTWMEILHQVEASVLVLVAAHDEIKQNLLKFASDCGVEPNRFFFWDRVSREDYLSRIQLIDIFLDTPIYNAGTTASDAIWMGTPVITLIGQSFASRIGASVLASCGLNKLITHSNSEYKELAMRLGKNADELSETKRKITENKFHFKLFDSQTTTKNIEKAYLEAIDRYVNSKSYEDIYI